VEGCIGLGDLTRVPLAMEKRTPFDEALGDSLKMIQEVPAESHQYMSRCSLWQICYLGAVVVLFGLAAWQRFALPLDPIADPDIGWFLSPALMKLVGGGFGHTPYGRNFVYPGFVYLLLRIFGDFRAITIVQHFLGLIAGGMLLLSWRRARVFAPNHRIDRTSYDALGLLATGIFLLAGESSLFEIRLRPEGVCAFLISINIYLVIQFTACSFIENRQSAALSYGIATVFTSILLADARPSFSLFAVVSLTPVAMFFFRRGCLRQKIALAAGAVVSAALLLLPEHFLSRHDEVSKWYLPKTLFILHADLVRDQMAEDVKHNAKIPYPKDWLQRIQRALSIEIAKSSAVSLQHHSTLGFNYDYLFSNPTSIGAQLSREFGNDVPALCGFYWFYYWRIWLERPGLVLRKIARQMMFFYGPKCPAYRTWKSLPLTNEYRRSVASLGHESYDEVWAAYPPAVNFMSRTETLVQNAPVIHQSAYIRRLLSILAITYRPLLLIALGVSAAVVLHTPLRRCMGWLAALVLFVYSYNVASCLEVAVIHALENPRYVAVQMYFTILAQFLALWFVLEFVLELVASAKKTPLDSCSA
jgi:hypothetical protein